MDTRGTTLQIRMLDLSLIDAHPKNPRDELPNLEKLAESIKAFGGVFDPILVRTHPLVSGRFQVEDGHRRAAASRLAGMTEIPAIIAHDADELEAYLTMIAAFEQREDLTASERERGLQGILEFGDLDTAARVVGLDGETLKRAKQGRRIVDRAKLEQATLEQLAALAEFEGTEYLIDLERAIGGYDWHWKLGDARRKLKRDETAEKTRAWAEAQGYQLIDSVDWNAWIRLDEVRKTSDDTAPALHEVASNALGVKVSDHDGSAIVILDRTYLDNHAELAIVNAAQRLSAEEIEAREAERVAREEFRENISTAEDGRLEWMASNVAGVLAKLQPSLKRFMWPDEQYGSTYLELDRGLSERATAALGCEPSNLGEVFLPLLFELDRTAWYAIGYMGVEDEDYAELFISWYEDLIGAGYQPSEFEREQYLRAVDESSEASEECPACKGDGRPFAADGSRNGNAKCPECKGTGVKGGE